MKKDIFDYEYYDKLTGLFYSVSKGHILEFLELWSKEIGISRIYMGDF